MEINELSQRIYKWRVSREFYTPNNLGTELERDMMLGKLMLVVTEIGEAAEAVRHADEDNFKEELADAIIRLFDIMETCGYDIGLEMSKKMDVNDTRPVKHGKLCSL